MEGFHNFYDRNVMDGRDDNQFLRDGGPNYTKLWKGIHFSPMLPEFVLGVR